MTSGRPRASERAFRVLLRLYPPEFRKAYGGDALELFRDRYRTELRVHGWLGIVLLWCRTVPTMVVHGLAERAGVSARGGFATDARQAVRRLRRDPALVVVGVASLAMGIGATTALFSVVRGVLLEPLPYPEPERLVRLWESNPGIDRPTTGPSPLNVADWQELNESLEGLTAWYLTSGTHRDDDLPPEEIRGAQVTPEFFDVMGVPPALGRAPVAAEVERHGPVVLSDGLWRRRFSADPGVLGRRITISGERYEVVGVMPPGFEFPDPSVELWLAWDLRDVYATNPDSRTWRFLGVVGRMRPGGTVEEVEMDLGRVATALAERHPDANRGWTVRALPLHDDVVGTVRPTLWAAFASVALLLFMACVNVANLLLARAPSRSRELAIRSALGADGGRTARQLLLENAFLGLLGGAAGLVVARILLELLVAMGAGSIPRLDTVRLSAPVLGFSVLVSLAACAAFGMVPVVQARRLEPARALREGSRSTASRAQSLFRQVLVATQVAVAAVLLVGVGLLGSTFLALRAVDPGFDVDDALTFRISLDPQGEDGLPVAAYYDGLLGELRSLPGVVAVGAAQTLPLNPVGNDFTRPYRPVGDATPSADAPTVQMRIATPDYFDAMGMTVLSGAPFSGAEEAGGPQVAVVNETLARELWPGASAVGETFELDFRGGWLPYRVVGVVAATRANGLRAEPRPEVYLAHRQAPYLAMTVVLRTSGDPGALVRPAGAAVRAYGPRQPAHHFVTLAELAADAVAEERLLLVLLGAFGSIALVLACTGVFGVMSYLVGQRTPELGLRLALGADRATVLRLVLGRAIAISGLGVLAGLGAALVLGQGIKSLLFSVQPWDPESLVAAAAVLLGTALASSAVPARQATRVDPAIVLRGS